MPKTVKTSLICSLLTSSFAMLLVWPCFGQVQEGDKMPFAKIRAGYMYSNNLDIPKMMAQNGLNLALVKIDELHMPIF